jgi:hypothetical protein
VLTTSIPAPFSFSEFSEAGILVGVGYVLGSIAANGHPFDNSRKRVIVGRRVVLDGGREGGGEGRKEERREG